MPQPQVNNERIVFFDGYCVFCNSTIDWLSARDQNEIFRFAPLQGSTARARLRPVPLLADPDSIIYLRGSQIFDRSTAILRLLLDLGGVWKLAGCLLLIPKPIRDALYDAFARVRYKIFGKRETCRLPTPQERARILD